jgi:hypothetical protein
MRGCGSPPYFLVLYALVADCHVIHCFKVVSNVLQGKLQVKGKGREMENGRRERVGKIWAGGRRMRAGRVRARGRRKD